MAIPSSQLIQYAPTGEWTFPNGSVFVKHFELSINETNPAIRQRLETRLLVRDTNGAVYGATYKWRADNTDADLLDSSMQENITVTTAPIGSFAGLDVGDRVFDAVEGTHRALTSRSTYFAITSTSMLTS